ncbi:MAG TPA: acyltransferase [Tepidiformaceae bacterium]|nr:acyltransferase [Tepidiformaceae bacterium]
MTPVLMERSATTWRRDGARGLLRVGSQVLRARWQLRRATRLGAARVWGRVHVRNHGTMVIEERVRLEGTTVRIDLVCAEGATLRIGEGTYINYGSSIGAARSVDIGANCMIGQYAIIMDSDQHDPANHTAPGKAAPVVIEDDVWLGARVTVLRGAHIGRGAVVGAHAVVTGSIPPRTLAAGVPARVIRSLDP